jgi:hypothetical protein
MHQKRTKTLVIRIVKETFLREKSAEAIGAVRPKKAPAAQWVHLAIPPGYTGPECGAIAQGPAIDGLHLSGGEFFARKRYLVNHDLTAVFWIKSGQKL